MSLLGYEYKDPENLRQALRHRSVGKPNNERLEFLGDSILNFMIAEKLYHMFHKANEGELTRLRASLVNRQSLAEIALSLKLDEVIELGIGEKKSGGFKRESILADALEAIIASISLDGGIDAAWKVIDKLYEPRLEQLSLKNIKKDPKTKLQEWLQSKKRPLPNYTILKSENRGHDSIFIIQCDVDGLEPIQGEGHNRRLAEQRAAQVALEQLDVD